METALLHFVRLLWVRETHSCADGIWLGRFIVAVIAYLVYWPPRPLRRRISLFLKEHPSLVRFRVRENVLVRWADQDVVLDSFEGDVVEGDDIHHAREEEQIPLKPSPRKGNIAFYGTTSK